jgi:hypothetical protein
VRLCCGHDRLDASCDDRLREGSHILDKIAVTVSDSAPVGLV